MDRAVTRHPSGRPVTPAPAPRPSMAARRGVGFVCPRLNGPTLPDINTYACGFMDYRPERPDLYHRSVV